MTPTAPASRIALGKPPLPTCEGANFSSVSSAAGANAAAAAPAT